MIRLYNVSNIIVIALLISIMIFVYVYIYSLINNDVNEVVRITEKNSLENSSQMYRNLLLISRSNII